jgi:hypothetical protein
MVTGLYPYKHKLWYDEWKIIILFPRSSAETHNCKPPC